MSQPPSTDDQPVTPPVGEHGPEDVTMTGPAEVIADKPLPRRKIGIVGFTDSRKQAPFDDPEWELWGLNNLYNQPDIDPAKFAAWFDLHPAPIIDDMPTHVEWLKAGADGLKVFTIIEPRAEWPTAVALPKDEIIEAFRFPDLTDKPYFTNSISWMMAFALLALDARCQAHDWDPSECEIGIWGIDMAELRPDGSPGEYAAQRPSVEFYIGIATGLGYKVSVPLTSDLLKTAVLYGDESDPFVAKMRERLESTVQQMVWLSEHINAKHRELAAYTEQKTAEINEFTARYNAHMGAKNVLEGMLGTWAPIGNYGNSTHEDPAKTESKEAAA